MPRYDAQGMALRRSAADPRTDEKIGGPARSPRKPAMAPRAFPTSAPSARWRGPPSCCRRWQSLEPGIQSRIVAFSDDMDGLREVPKNLPNAADAAGAPGQAPDLHPGPLRGGEVFRPLHEPQAARVPGLLRLPLRVRLLHGAVRLRGVRRRPAPHHGSTTRRSASCSRPPSRRRSAPRGARSSPSARTADGSTPRASRGWTRRPSPCPTPATRRLPGKYQSCGHAGTRSILGGAMQGGLEGGLGAAVVLAWASTTRCTGRTSWIRRGCPPRS